MLQTYREPVQGNPDPTLAFGAGTLTREEESGVFRLIFPPTSGGFNPEWMQLLYAVGWRFGGKNKGLIFPINAVKVKGDLPPIDASIPYEYDGPAIVAGAQRTVEIRQEPAQFTEADYDRLARKALASTSPTLEAAIARLAGEMEVPLPVLVRLVKELKPLMVEEIKGVFLERVGEPSSWPAPVAVELTIREDAPAALVAAMQADPVVQSVTERAGLRTVRIPALEKARQNPDNGEPPAAAPGARKRTPFPPKNGVKAARPPEQNDIPL